MRLLNQNIVNWLGSSIVVNGETIPTNVAQKYRRLPRRPELHRVLEHHLVRHSGRTTPASPSAAGEPAQQHPSGGRRLRRPGRGRFLADRRARTATWARTTRPVSTRSSSSTTATSIACSGCGRRSTRPPTAGDHPALSGDELGRQPGPDAGRRAELLADPRIAARSVQEEGRPQGAALHLARLHQYREATRLHLWAGLARREVRPASSEAAAPTSRDGGDRPRHQPGAHPRLVPDLRSSRTSTARSGMSAPRAC